jgi:hypothetical protein
LIPSTEKGRKKGREGEKEGRKEGREGRRKEERKPKHFVYVSWDSLKHCFCVSTNGILRKS